MVSTPRVILAGEAMLELSARAGGLWQIGYGGDTLNTAVHLARLGCTVAYASALGSDAFSANLRQQWQAEGLDCSLLLTDPARSTGLYSISLDAAGERTFSYWRSDSAARQMFALPDSARLAEALGEAQVLAFSLISLAILPMAGRHLLLDAARKVRAAGGQVVFDGNFRPRLWDSQAEAAHLRDIAIAVASIGLPTLEDEVALGLPDDAQAVAAHWQRLGCAETVVKLGAKGCLLPDGTLVPPPQVLQPVDTSGAGDAFNAGYLAARLAGASPHDAALRGHALAGWCVMRPGAIPPRDGQAPYA
ncbi:sugar kinase [Alteraurantiacibacter buctensis]|uniref:sugar kinase n=1 Tax=Alteraurantiacibacter buctensis TaxID=1503981 RepID=UPI003F6CD64B